MKKIVKIIKEHPLLSQFAICIGISLILGIVWGIYYFLREIFEYKASIAEALISFFFGIVLFSLFICVILYPIIVSIYELIFLICTATRGKEIKGRIIQYISDVFGNIDRFRAGAFDLFNISVGVIFELILISFIHEIVLDAQWFVQLSNEQLHTPISGKSALTFVVLLLMFAIGLIVISAVDFRNRAPLVTVTCISLMYIGFIEAVMFTIQIIGMNRALEDGTVQYMFTPDLLFTFLLPLNMIFILVRVMVAEIRDYSIDEKHMSKIEKIPFLSWCNRMMTDSKKWPIIAIVLMIPLLIIIIAILMLFGQAPDDAIKAFTETADYTFSTKIPPQNVFYDEHYLCTVAAGGHEKIVKPIRMGRRHGHDVVVNRQLLVANAFEQILEEKTPRFHYYVRSFYDKYGFPISKHIKSKTACDAIWFIMKPLEWIFLLVIYSTDKNPEDRIASQYL